MQTEMQDAKPHRINVVSSRKVVFTFDLSLPENQNLREHEVVTRSMAAYMLAYPNVESYTAQYLMDVLVLTCVGTVNPQHVHHVDVYS